MKHLGQILSPFFNKIFNFLQRWWGTMLFFTSRMLFTASILELLLCTPSLLSNAFILIRMASRNRRLTERFHIACKKILADKHVVTWAGPEEWWRSIPQLLGPVALLFLSLFAAAIRSFSVKRRLRLMTLWLFSQSWAGRPGTTCW